MGQMDGTNAKVLVAGDKSFSPDGLVIDITKQRCVHCHRRRMQAVRGGATCFVGVAGF